MGNYIFPHWGFIILLLSLVTTSITKWYIASVPLEWISRVNPNGGIRGWIPEKEFPGIANSKGDPSGRQKELILRCPRENSNDNLSWRQKELFLRRQRKQRGTPKKESLVIFIPKGDLSWHQKEINSEMHEGKFLCIVQFLCRSKLMQKGIHFKALAGEFCASRTIHTQCTIST